MSFRSTLGRSSAALMLLCSSLQADMRPETLAAYHRYIGSVERKLYEQNRSEKKFLWIDQDPDRRHMIREGQTPIERISAPEIPGGMIQHWIGGSFFPGVTLDQIKRVDQDYNRYKILYRPDIIDSKLLSRHGNHFEVYYRIRKQKVVTVVFDSWHQIDFISLGKSRLFVQSRCDHVREVKNPGEPSEQVLPEGQGNGFLWAMNSYWRMEEREGGTYTECEAITLARTIPLGMAGLIGPIIDSFAAESLTRTLAAKKRAVTEEN